MRPPLNSTNPPSADPEHEELLALMIGQDPVLHALALEALLRLGDLHALACLRLDHTAQ